MFKFIKSKGFTLLEVSIVVFILTLATVAKLKEETRDLRIAIGKAQGQQVKALREGLYSYGLKNFNAVINNTAVPGVAVTRAPTVTELKALGFLNSGFGVNAYNGAAYATSVTPAPTGCPVADCNIQGLAYMTLPITDPFNGAVDGPTIGEAVRQIGADGGASIRTPGTISGLSGGWSVPNPLGATRGILAARIGMGSELDFTAYLRRDGTLPMTGNLNLGGNSVRNLAVVVEGAACANTGELSTDISGAVLTCQGGVQSRQGSSYWRDPVATVAALPACNVAATGQTRAVLTPTVNSPTIVGSEPRIYTCSGSSWVPVGVDDNGNLTVASKLTTGSVQINTVVTEGAACTPNGLVARDSVGLILSCQSGIWRTTVEKQIAAGAACLEPMSGYWNSANIPWGGASCSGGSYRSVNCPAGTTKITVHHLRNSGNGGESALCLK